MSQVIYRCSLITGLRERRKLFRHKTKLAQAIRYSFSRWEGLIRLFDDGRIELDSNFVERIRPIARTRAWLAPTAVRSIGQ